MRAIFTFVFPRVSVPKRAGSLWQRAAVVCMAWAILVATLVPTPAFAYMITIDAEALTGAAPEPEDAIWGVIGARSLESCVATGIPPMGGIGRLLLPAWLEGAARFPGETASSPSVICDPLLACSASSGARIKSPTGCAKPVSSPLATRRSTSLCGTTRPRAEFYIRS